MLRVLWRITHATPPYAASFHPKEIKFAHYGHLAIYGLIGMLVLTGLLRYNIHSGAFDYLSIITIPQIIYTHNQTLYSAIAITHNLCGALLLAMVAVHIAMAINHHVFNNNDILLRMVPNA